MSDITAEKYARVLAERDKYKEALKAMSDFEVNKAVAEALRVDHGVIVFGQADDNPIHALFRFLEGGIKLDYCNSWSDAGPIIACNGIELSPMFRGKWCASKIDSYTFDEAPIYGLQYANENPLRAAMVVFLMSKKSPP